MTVKFATAYVIKLYTDEGIGHEFDNRVRQPDDYTGLPGLAHVLFSKPIPVLNNFDRNKLEKSVLSTVLSSIDIL